MTSPQPTRSIGTRTTSTRTRRAPEKAPQPRLLLPRQELRPSPEEAIRRRAHEIYLERGGVGDDPLGDWLQAEREYWFALGRPEKALWRGPHSPVR